MMVQIQMLKVSDIEPRFIQIIESSEFRISNKLIDLI